MQSGALMYTGVGDSGADIYIGAEVGAEVGTDIEPAQDATATDLPPQDATPKEAAALDPQDARADPILDRIPPLAAIL
jgi:hypothetical protein